jgi:hypothetical protein
LCCAHQGYKKSAGIKLLVNSAFEEKVLSITQTNCVIKVVNKEKVTKITKMITEIAVAIAAAV